MKLKEYIETNPDGYDLHENGVIRSSGKFEGEMIYVPYFYQIGLDGVADFDDGIVWGFELSKEDKESHKDLEDESFIYLEETNIGFVFSSFEFIAKEHGEEYEDEGEY